MKRWIGIGLAAGLVSVVALLVYYEHADSEEHPRPDSKVFEQRPVRSDGEHMDDIRPAEPKPERTTRPAPLQQPYETKVTTSSQPKRIEAATDVPPTREHVQTIPPTKAQQREEVADANRGVPQPARKNIPEELAYPPGAAEAELDFPTRDSAQERPSSLPDDNTSEALDDNVAWTRDEVRAYMRATGVGGLSADEMRSWRERMIEAAEVSPDSVWAPEALISAAHLSRKLREMDREEELLRAVVEHPRVQPTAKVYALIDLARIIAYARGDVAQAFEDWNLLVETIHGLEDPGLRNGWLADAYHVPLEKGLLLLMRLRTGQQNPPLRGEDAGKQASDYFQEFLDLPRGIRALSLVNMGDINLLQYLAWAFEAEGHPERAAETYRRMLAHPDNPHPPTQVHFWEAQVLYPEDSPELLKALLEIERTLPPDDWSRSLNYLIAQTYLWQGVGQEYLDRVEPSLLSDDPENQAFRNKGTDSRANKLYHLADSCQKDDVRDYERAIKYYQQILAEHPDWHLAWAACDMLGTLYEHEIEDYGRAIEYYEELLEKYPDEAEHYDLESQYLGLAQLYKRTKDYRSAIKYYEKLLAEFPDSSRYGERSRRALDELYEQLALGEPNAEELPEQTKEGEIDAEP